MGIQTYSLTHNLDGSLKNPWEKEFIDFSFNGKYISEFGLVAVFDGDRHTFAASPSFENETTTVNGAAGQLFWGTNIGSLKKTYTLTTDGMTEIQVNAFKNHFKPGKYGKFIEDKLAHRYGYCRVSEVIEFKVIPFRKQVNFLGFPLMVNEYKGDITITFEWDDPYTYSTINYIEEISKPTQENYNDVARAVYNNGIPLYSSWAVHFYRRYGATLGVAILGTMILGQSSTLSSKICHLGKDKCLSFNGSKTDPKSELINDTGHTGINQEDPLIFYNPSNTLTPATIALDFIPSFTGIKMSGEWQPVYFNNIADDINWKMSNFSVNYNSIEASPILKALKENVSVNGEECTINAIYMPKPEDFIFKFHYTNPNVIYSINRTIKIAYDFFKNGSGAAIDLEEKIREEIVHDKVAKWAISNLAAIRQNSVLCDKNDVFTQKTAAISLVPFGVKNSVYQANWFAYFNIKMLMFMCDKDTFIPYTITFDGQKSETKITYSYNQMEIDGTLTFFDGWEESCGDVLLTPYFNLEGGDTVDEFGNILSCHSLQFRQGGKIQNIPHASLQYEFIYL